MDKYSILLVDDEEDNLALLYRTLRGTYNLERTTSPLKALSNQKYTDFSKRSVWENKSWIEEGDNFLYFFNTTLQAARRRLQRRVKQTQISCR